MNEYRDTFSSLLKFCSDFSASMKAQGVELKVMNLDAMGDPQEWPDQDVVGLAEFDFDLDDGTIEVSMMIAVSTVEDTNNFRLNQIINDLVNLLIPSRRINLYNATNGQLRGFMVVQNGTRVAPPMKTKTRAIQPIMVSLLSDQTLR